MIDTHFAFQVKHLPWFKSSQTLVSHTIDLKLQGDCNFFHNFF